MTRGHGQGSARPHRRSMQQGVISSLLAKNRVC
jgi:hypothetical protein